MSVQSLIANEFYPTPVAFTKFLFDRVAIEGNILAPCCGAGAIEDGAMHSDRWKDQHWYTNDLDNAWEANTHLDAAKDELWQWYGLDNRPTPTTIDWVVENPAFTITVPLLTRALRTAKKGVALHLRASFNEVLKTGPRRTFLSEHPPTGLLWLPRFAFQRSKTNGKWSVDTVCTCWMIWNLDPVLGQRQFIEYAPETIFKELQHEIVSYRSVVDGYMGLTGTEEQRQQQRVRLG